MLLVCLTLMVSFLSAEGQTHNGTFIVTAPKEARIGIPYIVSVIMTEPRSDTLTGKFVIESSDSITTKIILFDIASTENKKDVSTTFLASELNPGTYRLKFEMTIRGKLLKDSTEIRIVNDGGLILVQTDKAIYKKSQTVKMRVVILNADLMPVNKKMDITIVDPDSNKVQKFADYSNYTGVITVEYEISNDPKMGDWKIQVQPSDGMGIGTERNFTVDAYVLPRFSVEVKPLVPFVYVADFSSIDIEVEGIYTYGEGVHGSASIECKLQDTTFNKRAQLVDGKAVFTITTTEIGDPKNLRQKLCRSFWCWNQGQQSFPLKIKAEVTEDETDEKQGMETSINFYTEPVAMELVNKKEYRKNMDYTVYIHITDPSGGPLLKTERSKFYLNVTITEQMKYAVIFQQERANLPTDMDDIIMPFTTSTITKYALIINAVLYDMSGKQVLKLNEYVTEYNSYGDAGVQISLMNSQNKAVYDVGDTMHVSTSGYSGKAGFKTDLFLFLFSKGKLIRSYEVSPGTVTDILIEQNMGLAPSASLLLYAISNENELVADEMQIMVSGLLKNQMTMEYSVKRQKVGRDVTLSVTSDPNSFIFLVAIDKGSQLLKAPNDITFQQVKEGIMEFDTREERDGNSPYPGPIMFRKKRFAVENFYRGISANEILETVGIVYMTDAHVAETNDDYIMYDMVQEAAGIPNLANKVNDEKIPTESESSNNVRKNFPESWIWLNEVTGSDGKYENMFTLPDTITAWTTRGFAISPTNGLGIATNVQVEGFKQFFVVVSLPALAVREDKIEVKLVVFNYFLAQKNVRVTLKQSQDYMIFRDSSNTTQSLNSDFTDTVQVPAGLSKGINVFIKPTTIGNVMIRVEATSGTQVTDVTDIVEKIVSVDPEGKTKYGGVQELFAAQSTLQTLLVNPEFPSDFVPDSRKITVSVTGDIFGQSLQNLDSMIRTPYGCGEQNMISLVPNIYAMSYMEAVNNVKPEIEQKAKKNMQQGYQRELNYKHQNGGFSAFGESDDSFSTWLTAFVMKSFAQASKFIFIDDKVLVEAKDAIMSQSNRDGSFNEPGNVIHKDMMTGTSGGPMLTAYVYIAFKETQNAGNAIPNNFDASLTLQYLENFYQNTPGLTAFQRAVLAYCFALGNSQQLSNVLVDLNGVSTISDDGDLRCWCDLRKKQVGNQKMYSTYDVKPSAIETASYVLLTHVIKGDMTSGRPIAKWMISQINGKGGYLSTQDTVMGLQALSSYAEQLSSGQKAATVTFKSLGQQDVTFTIDNDNAILLQSKNMLNIDDIASNGITIEVQGAGNIVAAVNWEYNINVAGNFPDLHVQATSYTIDYYNIFIEACVWYDGFGDNGMGMMYVDLPTGYHCTNMEVLQRDPRVQRVEFSGKTLSFYFNQLSKSKTCLDVKAMWDYIVLETKPSFVTGQFYYQPEKQSMTSYSLSTDRRTGTASGISVSYFLFMIVIAGSILAYF
ncbi:alpha-2-macroglobulin-like protein 1 isoform X4 [Mytilus trossulus]|uniref:alpha-2-macroglobulin-like protein 1 isoform X4 n=1 Tax=Mytilus trossulus TaxID=6551 RepID=UPI0030068E82